MSLKACTLHASIELVSVYDLKIDESDKGRTKRDFPCLYSPAAVSRPSRMLAPGTALPRPEELPIIRPHLCMGPLFMDFEVQRCTRHCAETGKQFEPDEVFYSVLVVEGADTVRRDYSAAAWHGPPEGVLGWWKSQMPGRNDNEVSWAPNDVMLRYFEELEENADRQDVRYVLGLLMVRRRICRLEDSEHDEHGAEQLVLYCPRNEKTYKTPVVTPAEQRAAEIQEELAELLFK